MEANIMLIDDSLVRKVLEVPEGATLGDKILYDNAIKLKL